MVSEAIAQALVELALFLEFSPESVIDSDAAVQAMEQLSSTLQNADAETRGSLGAHFSKLSKHYSGEQARFVETLAEGLGLHEE